MSRPLFALIWVIIVAIIFFGMWWGWRARARRDADVLGTPVAPHGALIAEFPHAHYVSTTPVGEPLVRVAAPGLRYRGYAEVFVREDGVTVEVRGERPVHIEASQVRGSGSAARRAGKAVEPGGLALLRWGAANRELESSFRFDGPAEHRRFTDAIDRVAHPDSVNEAGTGTVPEDEEGTR